MYTIDYQQPPPRVKEMLEAGSPFRGRAGADTGIDSAVIAAMLCP